MDNNTTIPSLLGPVNTIPSGLGPVSSRHVKPKPQDGVTFAPDCPLAGLWVLLLCLLCGTSRVKRGPFESWLLPGRPDTTGRNIQQDQQACEENTTDTFEPFPQFMVFGIILREGCLLDFVSGPRFENEPAGSAIFEVGWLG